MSKEKEKILILCVDRDDDIGVKTGIKTPIIGRAQNLEASTLLALKDPEDSDVNALFGAIRTYDSISSESNINENQIATITGSELGGIKADKKLRDQLVEVLKEFPADNVVLVTDGFSDEEVIPIIQSHIPIMSIRRIIVRHSESIEESWALFSKYFKRLITDPYYARWVLGVPGILLIILSLLWYFDKLINAGMVLLFFIGGGFLIKGFNLDKKITELILPNPPNLIRLFTTLITFILVGLDIFQTYGSLIEILKGEDFWWLILPVVIGYILKYSIDLLVLASCIFIIGIGVYLYFMRDTRIWWTIIGIVASIWMRQVALSASAILLLKITPVPTEYIINLIITIGLGIATIVATILITTRLSKNYDNYFKKSNEGFKTS